MKTTLTPAQASQKYKLAAAHIKTDATYTLHSGDLALDVLSLDLPLADGTAGLIVEGNLTLTGNLINENKITGALLHVTGNVCARNIALGGARVSIVGNLTVSEFLWTRGTHGSLHVRGNLGASFVLREKHATWIEGECDATCFKSSNLNRADEHEYPIWRLNCTFNDGNHQTLDTLYFREDLDLLIAGIEYDEEHDQDAESYSLNEPATMAALKAGENILHEYRRGKHPSHIATIAQLIAAQDCETEKEINWGKCYAQCTMDFLQQHADKFGWANIAEHQTLTEAFIERNFAHLDEKALYWLCVEQNLTVDFLDRHSDRIPWKRIAAKQLLTESFMEKYADKLNWRDISMNQPMTPAFVERHKDLLDWKAISMHRHRDNLEPFFYDHFAGLLDWEIIVKERRLSDAILDKHAARLDWNLVQKHQKASDALIAKHAKLDWKTISAKRTLTDEEIEAHKDEVDWSAIPQTSLLSEAFINKYADRLDWSVVSEYQPLTESLVRKYIAKIDWATFDAKNMSEVFVDEYADKIKDFGSVLQKDRSEAFLERHVARLNWCQVSRKQNLSEAFLEKYKAKLDWDELCRYRSNLSIEFLDRNSAHLNWEEVSWAQTLTETFIEKYADKVDWRLILAEQKNLSPEFLKKHAHRVKNKNGSSEITPGELVDDIMGD